jgi:hypothetical protein
MTKHNTSPPPEEPWDARYGYGTANLIMPDGSIVAYTHDRPDELWIALTLEWARAWGFLDLEEEDDADDSLRAA